MSDTTIYSINTNIDIEKLKHEFELAALPSPKLITPGPQGVESRTVIVFPELTSGQIVTAQGIVDQHVTEKDPSTYTITSSVDIRKDILVEGEETILETEEVNIEDHMVLLNSNVTVPEEVLSGIEIKRGPEQQDPHTDRAMIAYDERFGETHEWKCGIYPNLYPVLTTESLGYLFPVARSNIAAGIANRVLFNSATDGKISESDNLRWFDSSLRLHLATGSNLYFNDNGKITSLNDEHRIEFKRTSNVLELQELGTIKLLTGAGAGVQRLAISTTEIRGDLPLNVYNTGYFLNNLQSDATLLVRSGGITVAQVSGADNGLNFPSTGRRILFNQTGKISWSSADELHKIEFSQTSNVLRLQEYGQIIFSTGPSIVDRLIINNSDAKISLPNAHLVTNNNLYAVGPIYFGTTDVTEYFVRYDSSLVSLKLYGNNRVSIFSGASGGNERISVTGSRIDIGGGLLTYINNGLTVNGATILNTGLTVNGATILNTGLTVYNGSIIYNGQTIFDSSLGIAGGTGLNITNNPVTWSYFNASSSGIWANIVQADRLVINSSQTILNSIALTKRPHICIFGDNVGFGCSDPAFTIDTSGNFNIREIIGSVHNQSKRILFGFPAGIDGKQWSIGVHGKGAGADGHLVFWCDAAAVVAFKSNGAIYDKVHDAAYMATFDNPED